MTTESTPNEANVTLFFDGEDHTLGSLLRMQLLQDQEVVFAAYDVPHPLKRSVEVRVQTLGTPCKDTAEAALAALVGDLDAFEKAFTEALK